MKPTVSVSRCGPPAQAQRARGRVERVEEAVAHAHLGARQGVQQRRLAGVGVAHQRDRRQRRALALGALHRARALHVLEAPAQRRDAVARQPAVRLDLRLPRAPRADPAAEALEVAPQAAHAREVVLELGQLHLQLALRAARVRGEDVEDHRRAVHHRQAQRLLEVALLAGAQLVVARDHVRVARLRRAFASATLPGPRYVFGCGCSRRWTSSPTTPRRPCAAARPARRGHRPRAAPRCRTRAGGARWAPLPPSSRGCAVTALRPLRPSLHSPSV